MRMIESRRLTAIAAVLVCSSMASSGQADAFDLNGAWAGDAEENCTKVFTRKGSQLAFSDNSDVYGGGFIIEGNQIIGKAGRCRIKARKDDGTHINLITLCGSAFEDMQFDFKQVDANKIIRLFPGMEGKEIKFVRCPAP
jgi:hypothetical protein